MISPFDTKCISAMLGNSNLTDGNTNYLTVSKDGLGLDPHVWYVTQMSSLMLNGIKRETTILAKQKLL